MRAHVVYGPPGSGKTTEMLRRLEEAITRGVDRRDIGYFSFTKAAAEEALKRMNLRRSEKVTTLHAMAYRALGIIKEQVVDPEKMQEFADKTGIPFTGATLASERDLALGDQFLALQQLAVATMEAPGIIYNASERPGNYDQFQYFVKAYEQWKRANGYLDFSDMLVRYLERGPEFKARVVFIDEAQDLSPLQWKVVDKVIANVEEAHIGGDDDQAIYEWAGADPHGMSNFEERYHAERRILERSWRLPRLVYGLANNVISRVRTRVAKSYVPREEEGKIQRYGHIFGIDLDSRDTLLLYRNHSVREELEHWLIADNIHYHSTSGRPSPLQGRFAWAIRTFNKLRAGEDVPKSAADSLRSVFTAGARRWFETGGMAEVLRMMDDWRGVVEVPYALRYYFEHVDVDHPVNIRLGSIHSAKGREADRVVLVTAMGHRTAESMWQNPDAEARVWYVGVTRAKHQLDIVEGPGGYEL